MIIRLREIPKIKERKKMSNEMRAEEYRSEMTTANERKMAGKQAMERASVYCGSEENLFIQINSDSVKAPDREVRLNVKCTTAGSFAVSETGEREWRILVFFGGYRFCFLFLCYFCLPYFFFFFGLCEDFGKEMVSEIHDNYESRFGRI